MNSTTDDDFVCRKRFFFFFFSFRDTHRFISAKESEVSYQLLLVTSPSDFISPSQGPSDLPTS